MKFFGSKKTDKSEEKDGLDKKNMDSKNNITESPETELKTVQEESPQMGKTETELKTVQEESPQMDKTEKTRKLVEFLKTSGTSEIIPFIDFNTSLVKYPILEKINEEPHDVTLLESLSSAKINILQKEIYERLIVCPEHQNNFLTTTRLYCSQCYSSDISRLHLIEHKICGYIAEKHNYGEEDIDKITRCPSCKKKILNRKDEIRLPGMWYHCNSCDFKFDNVIIKLHCKQYNHDFDINKSELTQIYKYKLRGDPGLSFEYASFLDKIVSLLSSHGFQVKEYSDIKGKSGLEHPFTLYGIDDKGKSIAILLEVSKDKITSSQVNAMLVKVMDVSPTHSIFIFIPPIPKSMRSLVTTNNIDVIDGDDLDKNFSYVKELISKVTNKDIK